MIRNIFHEHGFIRGLLSDLQCKICKKICNNYDPGISCTQCQINICDSCIIKINEKLPLIDNRNPTYFQKKNSFISSILSGCLSEERKNTRSYSIMNSSSKFKCHFCGEKKKGIYFYKNIDRELQCCIDCILNIY